MNRGFSLHTVAAMFATIDVTLALMFFETAGSKHRPVMINGFFSGLGGGKKP